MGASCEHVEGLGGRDASKPSVHIIRPSAGPVTRYLRSAFVKQTPLSSSEK